jgi:hypothetical protein
VLRCEEGDGLPQEILLKEAPELIVKVPDPACFLGTRLKRTQKTVLESIPSRREQHALIAPQ